MARFKNFYFLVSTSFLVWMLFFDPNDFISQVQLFIKKSQLESQKEYYSDKISEVQKSREELFSKPYLLEKYARENYFMRKPNEDLFIITDK